MTYLSGTTKANGKKYMVEHHVKFRKELSVMVARGRDGQIESFPVVENIHNNNAILETSNCPCQSFRINSAKGQRDCRKIQPTALGGSGIFGIELFLTSNNRILVNEVSPRPHNSGHYSY